MNNIHVIDIESIRTRGDGGGIFFEKGDTG